MADTTQNPTQKSKARIFVEQYEEKRKNPIRDQVARIEASPEYVPLMKAYAAETGDASLGTAAEATHQNALKSLIDPPRKNYNPDRDQDTKRFYQGVEKTYVAQSTPPVAPQGPSAWDRLMSGGIPSLLGIGTANAQTPPPAGPTPLSATSPGEPAQPTLPSAQVPPRAAAAPTPPRAAAAPTPPPAPAPAPTPDTEYKVKSGDNVWNIAKKHYGLTDPKEIAKAVETISNRNGLTNGTDASSIKPFDPKKPDDPRGKLQLPADWKGVPGQKALNWEAHDKLARERQGQQGQGRGYDVNRAYNPDTDGPLKDGRVRGADGLYRQPGQEPQQQQGGGRQTGAAWARDQDLNRDPLNDRGYNPNNDRYFGLKPGQLGIKFDRASTGVPNGRTPVVAEQRPGLPGAWDRAHDNTMQQPTITRTARIFDGPSNGLGS